MERLKKENLELTVITDGKHPIGLGIKTPRDSHTVWFTPTGLIRSSEHPKPKADHRGKAL